MNPKNNSSFLQRVSKKGYVWVNKAVPKKYVHNRLQVIKKSFIISRYARCIKKNHPLFFKDFSKARAELLNGKTKVNFDYFSLEKLNFSTGSGTHFYKLSIGNKSFFVKEIVRGQEGKKFIPNFDDPRGQIDALLKAKTLISKTADFNDFFVAEPHFALSSENHLFLATDFYEGVKVKDILNSPKLKEKYPLFKVIDFEYLHSLNKFLEKNKIFDFAAYNLIYVPQLKKIVIFDLRLV